MRTEEQIKERIEKLKRDVIRNQGFQLRLDFIYLELSTLEWVLKGRGKKKNK